MSPKRIVCWFSCGAASAVAAKMVVQENDGRVPLVIACTHIKEEHPDNIRFLEDCERWFGHKITLLSNAEYSSSIYDVFVRTRYLVGPHGAACTRLLKKAVREKFQQPGDRHVFGFTAEEQGRYDDFLDANNIDCDAPLLRHGLSKKDCLALIASAGIELPMMYRLGYQNNNCIGCVKGGAGYWNKIRRDFPAVFEKMAQVEEYLGPGRTTAAKATIDGVRRRVTLRELPPDAGRYEDEPDITCGVVCQMAHDLMEVRDLV
jgi:hypothetical protein